MTQGTRLADTKLGDFPLPYDEMPAGSYWKVLSRKTGKPMDVNDPRDFGYWYTSPPASNLTGSVWGIITPFGHYGMLSQHTVREEDDGTISVRPGDGSSNSILVTGPVDDTWHGYIEHGVWSEC